MKYNRLLPLLIPFVVFILFEVFFFNPKMIYVSLVLANLLIFFAVRQFTLLNRRQADLMGLVKVSEISKSWFNFLILPSLFLTSSAVYSILFANKFFIQILFFLSIVFLYFYLRAVYYYLNQPVMYKELSLESISSYGNFLTFFFISSVIYGLQSFLNISVWPLIVILIVITFLIVYQVIWINKINVKSAFIYILIIILVLAELAWSISFLPLNFKVSGLILSVCYYMLTGLARHCLFEKLDKRTVKLYLSFGFGGILAVLLTAQWM